MTKQLIQHKLTLNGLISMTYINAKATPINDADYSGHITAIEPVQPIIWVHITPLVINSLGGGHTHTHTNVADKSNYKKPGAWLLV